MTLNTSTRVPVDDSYAALVGKAVYVFAYYEWAIIYIIEYLQGGFVGEYSRGGSMTSGTVRRRFQETIDGSSVSFAKVSKVELQSAATNSKV